MIQLLRFFLIFLLSAIVTESALAQPGQPDNSISTPKVLPPTPDVAQIVKPAQVNLGKFTGTAQFSIPLHQIRFRDVTLPISVDYTSNGVKVDQIASRVGMDWSLSAGGVISRTVMHADDEKKQRAAAPANLTNQNALAEYVYPFYAYNNPDYEDTQADEFTYSAAGLSGKFILDEDKDVVPLNISENKIEKHPNWGVAAIPWDFRITNGAGVAYYFGGEGARDKSKSESEGCGRDKWNVEATVAYHLQRIEYPGGDVVEFNYEALSMYVYYSGVTESVVRMYPSQPLWDLATKDKNLVCELGATTEWCATCYPAGETAVTIPNTTCPVKVTTNSVILSEILASDGTRVELFYSGREDQAGDQKYDSLIVYRDGAILKRFGFQYAFPQAGTYYTGSYYNPTNIPYEYKRMFLTDILEKSVDYSQLPLRHEFEYDNTSGLPPRLSASQDHFGYFNGAANIFYFPVLSDELNQFSMIGQTVPYEALALYEGEGADREPNFQYAKKGSLLRIKYPTGGRTEIDWEANTINRDIINYPTELSYSINSTGTGINGAVSSVSGVMTLTYDQKIRIAGNATALSGYDPLHNTVEIELKTLTGTVIYSKLLKGGDVLSTKVSVPGGEQYRIHVTSYGSGIQGAVNAYYRPGDTTHQEMDIELPGLRVKRLREIDGRGDTLVRRFYYTKMSDTTRSSGVASSLSYFNNFDIHKWYWDGCIEQYIAPIHMARASSSTIFSLHLYSQNPVNYPFVTESIGESFQGGGVENKFTIQMDGLGQLLSGDLIYNAPRSNNGYFTGTLERESVFKNLGGSLVPVSNKRYVYSTDSRNFSWVNNLAIYQKDVSPTYVTFGSSDPQILQFFDIVAYPRYSYWTHLDSTITELYDLAGESKITTIEVNAYESLSHYQLTKVMALDSKGNQIKKSIRYPHDFVVTGNVYDSMVKRNMVVPWVERKDSIGSVWLTTTKRVFDDSWYVNKQLIAPKTVEVQNAGSANETRLRFEKYSQKGDLLGARKELDAITAYIWDEERGLPIAQIANAPDNQVAYTSFENAAHGNWSYSGPAVNDGQTVSGFRAYQLRVGFTIAKSGLQSGKQYLVSYWTKNTSPFTVLGTQAGYPVAGQAINGWKMYTHLVSGITQVIVSGTGLIDELRLHPVDAQMNTLVYDELGSLRSSFDANHRFATYFYDGFKRLVLVKDQEGNLVKKNCYAYTGIEDSCRVYYSDSVSVVFTKSGCPTGYTGSTYTYTVPAGKYISTVSVQDATQRALREIGHYGQAYADQLGTCFIACDSPLCTGADKKCVGGRCETGVRVVTSSVQIGSHLWECTYHYEWSDGSWSPNYTEQSPFNCNMVPES